MTRARYWQHLATTDFPPGDPERCVALLPVAAVEQHGPHLPLGTDALINEGVVERLVAAYSGAASVLVLPPQAVGHSLEHAAFPGTLDAAAETLLGAWQGIGLAVARAGVRKLLVFNSHGGQTALVDLLAVRLRARARMLVARASYFGFGVPDGLFPSEEIEHGLHGGALETSLMLALHPGLVRREALADFRGLGHERAAAGRLLGAETPVGFGWMSQDIHPAGVCGNALTADAGAGQRFLVHLVESLAGLLDEMAGMPLATLRAGPLDP